MLSEYILCKKNILKLLSLLAAVVSGLALCGCFICCTIGEGVSKKECINTNLLLIAANAATNTQAARDAAPIQWGLLLLCYDTEIYPE